MKHRSLQLILLVVTGLAAPLSASTITGTLSVEMRPESTGEASTGHGYGDRRYKFLERVDYTRMFGAVVSIEGVAHSPDQPQRAVIAQRNGSFEPHVLPIVAGTIVEWPNRDTIFHNVFSMAEERPFDLGYYKREDVAKVVQFDQPGRIDVFCSIHSDMHCIVLVLPNPWFAQVNTDGRFEIVDVPPGTYTLKAWHERLPAKRLRITVPETGSVNVDIRMSLAELPKL